MLQDASSDIFAGAKNSLLPFLPPSPQSPASPSAGCAELHSTGKAASAASRIQQPLPLIWGCFGGSREGKEALLRALSVRLEAVALSEQPSPHSLPWLPVEISLSRQRSTWARTAGAGLRRSSCRGQRGEAAGDAGLGRRTPGLAARLRICPCCRRRAGALPVPCLSLPRGDTRWGLCST